MEILIGDVKRAADAYPAQESNGSSQVHAFNNVDTEEQSSLSPPREQTSNEAEESAEHRRIKVIPNGSVVRIILNNRNSKGKAASYLGKLDSESGKRFGNSLSSIYASYRNRLFPRLREKTYSASPVVHAGR